MSDEEKKAIDSITAWVDFEESTGGKLTPFRIVLNLIKKLSKEIEELKDESKEYQIGFAQGCYERDLDWKDKIKAKIEEIDEVLKGQLIEKIRVYFEAQKEVLQSLLEKE